MTTTQERELIDELRQLVERLEDRLDEASPVFVSSQRDLAGLLGLSYRTLQRVVATEPGFPRRRRLSESCKPAYLWQEVKEWANRRPKEFES